MKDNWEHRSTRMRCFTCMWFVEKVRPEQSCTSKDVKDVSEMAADIGRCRRHSPTLGGWPVIYGNDWCGDHKIDESKL